MKASEIQVGHVYRTNQGEVVKVLEIIKRDGFSSLISNSHIRACTRYRCHKYRTGREIYIKSAMRFSREIKPGEEISG